MSSTDRRGSSRVIGITLGDAAGIGPEIVDAALESGELDGGWEYRIFGSRNAQPGQPTPESSREAIGALEETVRLGLAGELAAVVTGPISKALVQHEGFAFPGQTEFFATRTATQNYAMCLTGGELTVALVTAHIPLRDVPALLSAPEIVRVGGLLADFLVQRNGLRAKIAVSGLNPHAGESGALGREEIELIAPATLLLNGEHGDRAEFCGPLAPDTVFNRAVAGEFDGVLCMYHDQGLIPLKLHAFDRGVNVTLGLPFPRTSPDHGTAFDLAGKKRARADSMIAAIQLATDLAATS
jgi:4-hydroxythreonine-4-phosphate dehydrogenase